MNDTRKALGKGLSSLIPSMGGGSRVQPEAQKTYFECPLIDIIPNPNQPRKLFAREAIDELAASIEEKGIIQPLVVRKIGGGKYEIIAGERRYRASQQLKLERVPVIVKEIDDKDVLELALIENIQRQDLNPIEEALAYKELLTKYQHTQDELAKRVGKDRTTITNALRLLKLPEAIRAQLISNSLSMGHARAILAIDDADLQVQIANDIMTQNLSVREVEAMIRAMKQEPELDKTKIYDAPLTQQKSSVTQKSPTSEWEHRLKDKLKLAVKISNVSGKGQLAIKYNTADELNVLLEKLMA